MALKSRSARKDEPSSPTAETVTRDRAVEAAKTARHDEARKRLRRARLRRHRLGIFGLVVVVAVAIFVIVGPLLIPHDPNQQNLAASTLPFFSEVDGRLSILGTDPLGRDVLARLAVGGRASLLVVVSSLIIGGGLGVTLGLAAGFFGGWVDSVVGRIVDAQLGLPTTIFAMIIAAGLGVGFVNTVLALGFASWPIYARVVRAEVLRIRNGEHILAARTIGVSTLRMIRVHVLPSVTGTLAVVATLELGRMIILESILSFVGLGMQPPDASWGSMIKEGQEYIYTAWLIPTLPGLMILITVLGMNLVGDWIRDILDPRTR